MTFDPLIPLSSDSPSIFPAQSQGNFTRLQALLSADHQFNLSIAANDGYHNLVHLTQQAPAGALASTGRVYAKSSAGRIHQFYMDDTGAEYQMSPSMPIRAAVNFNGTIAGVPQTIRSGYNVTSVSKTATGTYTITFTTAMPNANYIVQLTGMRNTSGSIAHGSVLGAASYASSVTTASVKVTFVDSTEALTDVLMGNVTIFSVT